MCSQHLLRLSSSEIAASPNQTPGSAPPNLTPGSWNLGFLCFWLECPLGRIGKDSGLWAEIHSRGKGQRLRPLMVGPLADGREGVFPVDGLAFALCMPPTEPRCANLLAKVRHADIIPPPPSPKRIV
ncbi:hypothetical protein DPEC_G00176750 [Dallia pectoralis]|uniref:Uncharacterized protein n=1 Tax=Dallia pectoralis TaxID=75939 RepID=A0ACC2GF28_DALPE|nr:hypothetical protein DPEC_G00176750 [Dallia pectoralis]